LWLKKVNAGALNPRALGDVIFKKTYYYIIMEISGNPTGVSGTSL
jgi:hypothetical protein